MSQPPNDFVPLVPRNGKPAGESSLPQLKSVSQSGAPSGFEALKLHGTAAGPCAKPTITLQRQGEVVSAIRIQCSCGQVIELECVY